MQNTPPIGTILETEENRDAIHIAIAPVVAGERLYAGQHIALRDGKAFATHVVFARLGIVDPYLMQPVEQGQRFFLFLYPKTVTSLRHEWTHPAFDGNTQSSAIMEASMRWIEEFARSVNSTAGELMAAALNFISTGGYLNEGEKFEGIMVPDEFWDHYEKATGKTVDEDKRRNFFSCSC